MAETKDLHKNENFQSQCLEQFREWIEKDSKIKKCRTDDEFLLRFLRFKKYSVPKAFKLLTKHLTARKLVPHYFENLDPNDPDIDHLISSGFITILPQPDPHGSPIGLYQLDNFDMKRSTVAQCARFANILMEIYSCDPRTQMIGVTIILDYSALTYDMLELSTLNNIYDCVNCWKDTVVVRPHVIYIVNMPFYVQPIYKMVKPFLKEKIQKKIKFVTGWEVVQQEVGLSSLPKELGGTIPRAEFSRLTKIKTLEYRDKILAMSDFDIEVDRKDLNFGNAQDSELDAAIVGSFRKLEVD